MGSFENSILCTIADFYSSLEFSSVPSEVIEKSRRVLVDFLSEVAAGFNEGEFAKIVNSYFEEIGGKEEATILCRQSSVPATNAAMAMGVMGHSIELDDGHRWGTCHPAVAIVPAVIAMGEREKSSFAEILSAIAIGYDVMLRAARAINPSHLKRGFHSTGTCGSLGAAAGCGWLLKLDSSKLAFAVSMGGLQSAGLQEMLHDHPGIKTLQPGKAAMAGILSADFAARGAKAPRSLFEGQHGWLKAMCDGEYSRDALVNDLGTRWEILNTYTKLYPTCRHCHAAIDLAREARKDLACRLEEIESLNISLYSLGAAEVGQIFNPASFEEAMFSVPFAVAIALERGNVTLQDYTKETLENERLKGFASKINIIIDEEMDRIYPEERGCRMEIRCKDGRIFQRAIPVAKGEPENPVNDAELFEKLEAMLQPYYKPSFLEGLWEICVRKKISDTTYRDVVDQFGRFHEK